MKSQNYIYLFILAVLVGYYSPPILGTAEKILFEIDDSTNHNNPSMPEFQYLKFKDRNLYRLLQKINFENLSPEDKRINLEVYNCTEFESAFLTILKSHNMYPKLTNIILGSIQTLPIYTNEEQIVFYLPDKNIISYDLNKIATLEPATSQTQQKLIIDYLMTRSDIRYNPQCYNIRLIGPAKLNDMLAYRFFQEKMNINFTNPYLFYGEKDINPKDFKYIYNHKKEYYLKTVMHTKDLISIESQFKHYLEMVTSKSLLNEIDTKNIKIPVPRLKNDPSWVKIFKETYIKHYQLARRGIPTKYFCETTNVKNDEEKEEVDAAQLASKLAIANAEKDHKKELLKISKLPPYNLNAFQNLNYFREKLGPHFNNFFNETLYCEEYE